MKKLAPTNLELLQVLVLISGSNTIKIGNEKSKHLIELGFAKKHFEERLALTLPGMKVELAIRKTIGFEEILNYPPLSDEDEKLLGEAMSGKKEIGEVLRQHVASKVLIKK